MARPDPLSSHAGADDDLVGLVLLLVVLGLVVYYAFG